MKLLKRLTVAETSAVAGKLFQTLTRPIRLEKVLSYINTTVVYK